MRSNALIVLSVVALLVALPHAQMVSASSLCSIQIEVDPTLVHYPGSLPSPGQSPNFGEQLFVNYSTSLSNDIFLVQYSSGSRWLNISNFFGNSIGFTATDLALNSGWALQGRNTVRVTLLNDESCTSNSATFTIQQNENALTTDILFYLLFACASLGFIVLAKKVKLLPFLIIAGAAYLAISPFTGQRYDVYFLLSSGIRMLQHVNPFNPGHPPVYPSALKWAYPPIYPLYSALSFLIYQLSSGASLPSVSSLTYPGWMTSTYSIWRAFVPNTLPALVFLLKIPMVASSIVTGVLVSKISGVRASAAIWIANPLVVFIAAIWGQLDPIATFLAVLSLYYYRKGKIYHAYLFASFGAAVKIWPIFLIPLFLAFELRRLRANAIRPLVAILPATFVSLLLYSAYGNLSQTLFVFAYSRAIPTYGGQFSVNGLTWQEFLTLVHSPPIPLFLYVGIPSYVGIFLWIWLKGGGGKSLEAWIIIEILIFFLTYNYVNPQYFYWILPFLLIRFRRFETWVFTLLPLVYLAAAYNWNYFISPALVRSEYSQFTSVAEQLKLTYFYQTPLLLLTVTAVIPTLFYVLLLVKEAKSNKSGTI